MELMTKKEIYQKIRDWEMDAGESFVDYFDGDIRIQSFMFWCLGRDYLTQEQFHAWEADISVKLSSWNCSNAIIGGTDYLPYAICDMDNWEYGLKVLAEFISESTIYQKRLRKFLGEWEFEKEGDECE